MSSQKILRIIGIVLLLWLVFSLGVIIYALNSCNKNQIEYYESGDFYYTLIKDEGEKKAAITSLSKEGALKEVIIIPEYINGYKVYGLRRGSRTRRGRIKSDNLEKIYIMSKIYIDSSDIEWGCKAFAFDPDVFGLSTLGNIYYDSYLPSSIDICLYKIDTCSSVYNANVTYYVDEEIYWIDDYDNSLITFIPPEPVKDGYTFDGWYKDSQYNNKWDFEIDTIPEKEYDSNKEYIYNETKLFAKFIAN